jgi:hypothetical protein
MNRALSLFICLTKRSSLARLTCASRLFILSCSTSCVGGARFLVFSLDWMLAVAIRSLDSISAFCMIILVRCCVVSSLMLLELEELTLMLELLLDLVLTVLRLEVGVEDNDITLSFE